MSKLSKFIAAQWHDVKGNAKWDFIKWGVFVIAAAPAATMYFIRNAPLWQVLIAMFLGVAFAGILLCGIAWVLNRKKLESNFTALKMGGLVREGDNWFVKIENPNLKSFAENLRVNLISITPRPKSPDYSDRDLELSFPVRLYPREKDGDLINAGDSSLFWLLKTNHDRNNIENYGKLRIEILHHGEIKFFEYDYFAAMSGKNPVFEYRFKISISSSSNLIPKSEQTFLISVKDDPKKSVDEFITWSKVG